MDIVFDPFDVEGIRQRVAGFIAAQGPADVIVGPLRRYTVGFSWVTYGFHAAWREGDRRIDHDLILRVGPSNGLFGPYKASPQFLTLKSLEGTAVPIPRVYWYSDEDDVLGAPFFICEHMKGEAPLPWTRDGGLAFSESERQHLGGQFLRALAALHLFDWRNTPAAAIDGSSDPKEAALVNVAYWEGFMHEWSQRRFPILEWAAHWFKTNAPVAPRISIVHGDWRIGNFLVDNGDMTAMLDWEIVRRGDPIEDLGWICMQAWRGRLPYMCHLFTREELCERYEQLTGIKVDARALRYWEAFGTFKLTVMHLGAAYCFDKRGFNDLRMAGMNAQIPRMLSQVESSVERAA